MRILTTVILTLAAFSYPVQAQKSDSDGDTIVSVQKKYVSAEGLTHQESNAHEWIGIGKEVGQAVREGLDAVVDKAEKFGTTRVGTFVMVMIAWKVMAKEVLSIVLGIPILIAGCLLWVWGVKRFLIGYTVLDRVEGKTKTYKAIRPVMYESSEARMGVGILMFVLITTWVLVMVLAVIF